MHVISYVPFGYEGILLSIEADIRRGLPGIDITGLAQRAVREASERVRAAFRNGGFQFPQDRILVNLAPAEVKKDGAALDLPIALAVLAASGQCPQAGNVMVLGELELSGRLRPVRGVLAATDSALKAGIKDIIVPFENAREASILAKGHIVAVRTLLEAAEALSYRAEHGFFPKDKLEINDDDAHRGCGDFTGSAYSGDFSEIRGQARYKRVLEIMAAGGHNALVFGTPGAGKTMLARRISGIMADLAPEDAVTATRLYSLAGALVPGQDADMSVERGALITRPPFRSPHHSASSVGILGGGKTVKPGEISLAHGGVLFLDEAPQFHRDVLQSLRGPLEDRWVTISRAEGQVKLPASFQLLLAANPCPCGRLGLSDQNNTKAECYCSDNEIKRYWRRFGEALLDRVELRVPVHAPSIDALAARENTEESSAKIRARVEKAVRIQRERFYLDGNGTRNNAGMSVSEIEKHCVLDEKAESAMRKAVEKLGLSGRAYHGVLRVARTVADLDGNESISGEALLEAVAHRRDGDDPYVFNQQPRHGCYT